jgi:hypothetical protein
VTLLDFDGDGDLDVFFTNSGVDAVPTANQLLSNQLLESGAAVFLDESFRLPYERHSNVRLATTSCDVNADGAPDMIVTDGGRGPASIFLSVEDVAVGVRFSEFSLFPSYDLDPLFVWTNKSFDVACEDLSGPDGTGGPDGYPEILFGRTGGPFDVTGGADLFLVNQGDGSPDSPPEFVVRPDLFLEESTRSSVGLTLCDLDGGGPELLVAKRRYVGTAAVSNVVLARDPVSGEFGDVAEMLGFGFATLPDVTQVIACLDVDGEGLADLVIIGNAGERNWLYRRQ